MADRTVTTDLVGNDRMSPASNSASRSVSKLGSVMGKVGNVAKLGLAGGAAIAAGGVAALGAWVVQGVKDAASFQKVLAKTAQVLKSTGNAAGTSVEGVKNLAAELETMSGVDEELIINSQNVLATFTNIRNVGKSKIFDEATKSALDMSVALGSDLQGASIQVGKALNDPIKGVSALSKVGVTFTDTQKGVIKKLVETGKTAEAQQVILAELNKEFGGQAKAAGAGFEGTMARVQDVIGDTGREIGTALLPKLTEAADWLSKKMPIAVQDFKDGWSGAGKGGESEIGKLADSLHRLSDQMTRIGGQGADVKANGFVQFAHWAIDSLTTVSEGFELLGVNWRLVTLNIGKWGDVLAINWQKAMQHIAEAGSHLPGSMGKHFREMRDQGKKSIDELQAKINTTNVKVAEARVDSLEIQLRHLGRQKPTPKVNANIAAAKRELLKVRGYLNSVKGKTVTVHVNTQYAIYGDKGGHYEGGTFVKNAKGGPVYKGVPTIVGDGGREELFVPDTDGTILPKVPPMSSPTPWSAGAGGGGGGGNTYITVNVSGVVARNYAELGDTVVKAMHAMPAGARKLPARVVAAR